jgi:hypothetical protein
VSSPANHVGRAGITRLDELGYEAGAASLRCVTASALRSHGAWQDADLLAAQALQAPGRRRSFVYERLIPSCGPPGGQRCSCSSRR